MADDGTRDRTRINWARGGARDRECLIVSLRVTMEVYACRCRTDSYKHTALATLTFRLSTEPSIGIVTN